MFKTRNPSHLATSPPPGRRLFFLHQLRTFSHPPHISETDSTEKHIMTTNDPLSAESVFDTVGPRYEEAFANLAPQTASIQWLLSQLSAPSKIVDIGCGTGRPVCAALAAAGHDVLGIDISAAMIAAARERVPEARFEKRDLREWLAATPEGELDAVTAYFSLIAGVTQAGIKEVMGEVGRVLKRGGLFVFATVPLDVESEEIVWMGNQVRVSSLAAEEVVGTMRGCGFEVLFEEVSAFTPRGEEAGICKAEEVWEEPHLFVYARKPAV